MADQAPIDFYFEFSSPQGYLASLRIDEIAAKRVRETVWLPFLLGAVFQVTGHSPLTNQPLRGDYAWLDFDRSARLQKAPFMMPEEFLVMSLAACRAFYWLEGWDPAQAKQLVKALYFRIFGEDQNISAPEAVIAVAETLGHNGEELAAALQDPVIKERLKAETQAAIHRGVFDSPFVIVDGAPFWGADRLDQVDAWLESGGW